MLTSKELVKLKKDKRRLMKEETKKGKLKTKKERNALFCGSHAWGVGHLA